MPAPQKLPPKGNIHETRLGTFIWEGPHLKWCCEESKLGAGLNLMIDDYEVTEKALKKIERIYHRSRFLSQDRFISCKGDAHREWSKVFAHAFFLDRAGFRSVSRNYSRLQIPGYDLARRGNVGSFLVWGTRISGTGRLSAQRTQPRMTSRRTNLALSY